MTKSCLNYKIFYITAVAMNKISHKIFRLKVSVLDKLKSIFFKIHLLFQPLLASCR